MVMIILIISAVLVFLILKNDKRLLEKSAKIGAVRIVDRLKNGMCVAELNDKTRVSLYLLHYGDLRLSQSKEPMVLYQNTILKLFDLYGFKLVSEIEKENSSQTEIQKYQHI